MSLKQAVAFVVAGTLVTSVVQGAVIAPVKAYAKIDEPVAVTFLNEKGEEGKAALAKIGPDATKLETLFSAAAAGDVFGADGAPSLSLVDSAGRALKASPGKLNEKGELDLAAVFPQIREPGTYFLTWKDATPLVIETLRNPVPWQAAKENPGLLRQFSGGPAVITHMVPLEYAVITTDKGVMKAKFSYEVAPHTIDSFIDLARHGFYDNSGFHRIIKGFMIQGGDSLANTPDRAGTGGPGFNVSAEISDKKHVKGTLSMARMPFSLDTAGGQFFIIHEKAAHLDGQYTAFGDVYDGLPLVDQLANTPAKEGSGEVAQGARPKIVSIRILPATPEIYGLKK